MRTGWIPFSTSTRLPWSAPQTVDGEGPAGYQSSRRWASWASWSRAAITVLDQDQGRSGSSATNRDGFQLLIAQVGLGQAGAVLSLEASRLARSCSDWYRLLEICALADTLVIDEEGIYDPSDYNDRLLLGFKGTMSEVELHLIRSRLVGGVWEAARRGDLRTHLPVGQCHE